MFNLTKVLVTLFLIAGSKSFAGETSGKFQFQVKEVGSPDELHPYANCTFNKTSFECHIDTGMKQTELNNEEFYKKIAQIRTTESKDAFGKISKCSEYKVASLSLDSASEKDFFIKRCEGKRLHTAVLGIDFFRGKQFELNFDKQWFDFSAGSISEGDPLLLLVDGYIGLSSSVEKSNFVGLIDTGVGKTVIDEDLVTISKEVFSLIEQSEVSTPTGGKFKIGLYKAKKLKIGSKEYSNVLVQAMPFKAMKERFGADVRAIVGNNIIMQENWHFDLVNRRYKISPSKFLELVPSLGRV